MISSNIRRIAKLRGITASQIERDLNLARGGICKMSEHAPSVITIKRIADYLDVSIDELMEGVATDDRKAN